MNSTRSRLLAAADHLAHLVEDDEGVLFDTTTVKTLVEAEEAVRVACDESLWRDEVACAALPAVIRLYGHDLPPGTAATYTYMYADAMLEERRRFDGTGTLRFEPTALGRFVLGEPPVVDEVE